MSGYFEITARDLSLANIAAIMQHNLPVSVSEEIHARVRRSREFLVTRLADGKEPIYGVNTGFGGQYKRRIDATGLRALQHNLLLSHAAGAGKPVVKRIARLTLLLKIISLAKGYSAVRPELLARLVAFFNRDTIPVIYEFGSLGASGDLAPLAHLALAVIGQGEIYGGDGPVPVADSSDVFLTNPFVLEPKEGLALVNGTQFSAALGVDNIFRGQHLLDWSSAIAAMSICAFSGNPQAFDPVIAAVRRHAGQEKVMAQLRDLLGPGYDPADKHLQDPYSFRCVPQVHGTTSDVIDHVASILETEVNAVTDNPIIDADGQAVISGGNFHAQPLALAMDYLAIGLAELGSISERRAYKLLNGERKLPPSLSVDPGIQSGLMISQYTAAALVNRNKTLCTPSSADSIVTSMGQEDHVSMAANAGLKLGEIANNTETILAIELLCAGQAMDLRDIGRAAPEKIRLLHTALRKHLPYVGQDANIHDLIKKCSAFMRDFSLDQILTR